MQKYLVDEILLKQRVSKSYYEILYLQNIRTRHLFLDSLLSSFSKAANLRYQLGETNNLERLTALAKKKEVEILLAQTNENISAAYSEINSWLQSESNYVIEDIELPVLSVNQEEISKQSWNKLFSTKNYCKQKV